ncbi:glycosyltransferase family 39 protein [bacterium]|nr:glycosyltransferase family 39 protein [bacterium]
MNPETTYSRPGALLIGISIALLAIGVWLRVHDLGRESFWIDEVFSARIVEGPPSEILNRIPRDKPPLDYYIQSVADRLPLAKEVSHRLPEAIAGVITLVLIFGFARRLFGSRVAWATLALASAHALLIHYSREARPYAMITALLIGQMWLFWEWWVRAGRVFDYDYDYEHEHEHEHEKNAWAWLTGLGVVTVVALYTLYATALVLACELLFVLIAPTLERRRFDFSPLFWFLALIGVVVLAALPLRSRVDIPTPSEYFWKFTPIHPAMLVGWIAEHLAGPQPQMALAWGAALLGMAFVLIGSVRAFRADRRAAAFVVLWSIGLPVAAVVFYALINRKFYSRYTIYCVPGLCMLMAQGALAIAERVRRPFLMPAIVLAAAAAMLAFHAADRDRKTDWRAAARYLRERVQPGQRIVATSHLVHVPLEYYLHREGVNAPLFTADAAQNLPDSPYWRVDQAFGDQGKTATVRGVMIEPLAQAPPIEKLGQLTAALGDPPAFRPGWVPAVLLGSGWSEPETWSKDFSVRWLTRTVGWFNFPLLRAAPARLSITLMPFQWPGGPPQWIQPRVGTLLLERRALPAGFSTQTWQVPAGALTKGYNRIELGLSWVHSPAQDKPGYSDFRTLGAAIAEINVIFE